MKITPALLKKHNACADNLTLFTAEWPKGCEVTLANCLRAAELGLDFDWASKTLLTPAQRAKYRKAIAPAEAKYLKAIDTARAEYQKAIAPAWAAYQKAIAPAWAAYLKAIDAAWVECQKAIAPARAEYEKAKAVAFYDAFTGESK